MEFKHLTFAFEFAVGWGSECQIHSTSMVKLNQ